MSVLQQLLNELGAVQKHTTPTGTTVGANLHGPGGLFGVEGLERDIISTRMQPSGLAGLLPVRMSIKTDPKFGYITGFRPPVGNQPGDSCSEPPTAGSMKTCTQTAQFGLYRFQTRELDINTVGQIIDAGETVDFRLLNDPLAEEMGSMFTGIVDSSQALTLGREVLQRFLEIGVAFQDLLTRQVYVGTGLTGEFMGLELLVSETKVDAFTGQACPSLRSDVRDFGDVDVTTAAGAAALVATLQNMLRNLKHMAQSMNFGDVQWLIVGKKQATDAIIDILPCSMMTNGCLPSNSNVSINIDTQEQLRRRLEMHTGSYLWIDNDQIPFINDDGLVEDDLGDGTFSSDIYILPLTVRGGQSVLYWEVFDYSRGTVQSIRDGRATNDFWTDGGHYLWHKQPPLHYCTVWEAKVQPRLVLRTPHLAGRLQNVAYTTEKHYRDAIVGDIYYVNGGMSGYDAPTVYSEANPPA